MASINISRKPLKPLKTVEFLQELIAKNLAPAVGNYFTAHWTWKWSLEYFRLTFCIILTATCYIFDGFKNRHNSTDFIFSLCLITVDFIGTQKLFSCTKNRDAIIKAMKDLKEFTKKWEQEPEGFQVLLWYSRILHKFVLFVTNAFKVGGICLSLAPVLFYLVFGEMILCIQCFIPGIDYKSHPGFELHVFVHGVCCYLGVNGLSAVICTSIMILAQNCIKIDVLRETLKPLNKHILSSEKDEIKITQMLKDIYQNHESLIEYVDICEDFYSIQNLSDHFLLGVLTCLGLFICSNQFWLPGYVLISLGFIQIFLINCIGTLIEVKFEKLSMDTYEIPWYLLSIKNQRMFRYFLQNTQKTDRLSIGGRVPLCLDTFVRFYKVIYSLLMVLIELQV